MKLYNNQGNINHLQLEDETGKKLDAKLVFSMAIAFFKDDAIGTFERGFGGEKINVDDIQWVLTVPAIWNDSAKSFMRQAAEEAGIEGDKLTIALEPESASLYCRSFPVANEAAKLVTFKPGQKYMILDAGGGTVDITVHQVTQSCELKELHKASGGQWGGTKVDEAFEKFMDTITGKGVMKVLREHNTEDYLEMCRTFEGKKRQMSNTTGITLWIPCSLSQVTTQVTTKDLSTTIADSKYKDTVSIHAGNKLKIDANVVASFFKETVSNIVAHVDSLLQHPAVSRCGTLLMVGGFSASLPLQEAVKMKFTKLEVIVPLEAELVVVKGAVIFGHEPKAISERICKFTYGTDTTHEYSSKCSHKSGLRKKDINDKMRCYDLFDIHVHAGESVKLGEEQRELIAHPINSDQDVVGWGIFTSPNYDPQLTTGPDCTEIGYLEIPIRNRSRGRAHTFGVSFLFGGTEIEVKVVDKEDGNTTIIPVKFYG